MANISFKRGSNLANLPIVDGQFIVHTGENAIYTDVGTERIRLGDFIQVDAVANLPTDGANASALYYCVAENVLAKWNGSGWTQINKQRTAEEIKTLIGLADYATKDYADQAEADAIASAKEYTDTEVKKVSDYVGTIPEGATATNVVAYVQEKTAGIATSENLEELTERVTQAEKDIDDLQAATGENGSVTTAIAAAQSKADEAAAAAKAAQDTADSKTTMADVEAKGYQTAEQVQAIADGKDEAIQAAQDAADAAQADVDAVEKLIGEVAEGKTVVEMITDATYDDTALAGRVKAIEDDYLKAADKTELSNAITAEKDRAEGIESGLDTRLKAVEDDYLKTADKTALQEQITTNANAIERLTNGVSAEEVDGVNDLIQYVKDHGTEVTGMKADIKANADAIDAIEADYLKAADKTALQNSIDGVAGRMTTAEGEIDALQEASHTHANADVLNGITAEKVAAWDAAEANAEAHADGLNSAMDTRVKALEAIDHEHDNKALLDTYTQTEADLADAVAKKHEHTNKDVLDGITAAKVSAWDSAEANANAYADGLASNYDAAGSAADALADAKEYADSLADNYDAAGSAAQALTDAKAYADGLAKDYDATGSAAAAESAAKAYTDTALTWGEF